MKNSNESCVCILNRTTLKFKKQKFENSKLIQTLVIILKHAVPYNIFV